MLIQSDYHIHASFYRIKREGAETGPRVAEQQAAARAAGCRYVGIVEHCNATSTHPFHCLEELAAEYYADGFDRKDTYLGVEADLYDDGSDHCGDEGRKKLGLHYVIGSIHVSPKSIPTVEEYIRTEFTRIRNAIIHNRNIDVIGHPFGEGPRYAAAGIIPRWGYDLIPKEYLQELVTQAKEHHVALEINRCDMENEAYIGFWKAVRDNGVLFEIGSDAHFTKGCPTSAERTSWAESLGLKEENHWKPFA
jgi:histidinol phosphatase-like PHP family hydrolase